VIALLLSSIACPDWESASLRSPPPIDVESPDTLEPGSALRISREPARWSTEGWLRLTPIPEALPELWIVTGDALRFRALVVAGDGPAVIVLPHLQGTMRIPEYVARRFAREGYQVVAVMPPEVALRPGPRRDAMLRVMRERILQGRTASRLAARELGAHCRVLIGISVGGMAAIPVAALEEDLDGVISILAGGGLGWIAEHSKEPLLQDPTMPSQEGSASPATTTEASLVDPLAWAPRLSKSRALMIRAIWDQVIPPPATHALWDALGQPEIHAYPSGHYSFGIFLPHAVDRALEKADAWCREISPPRADEGVEE